MKNGKLTSHFLFERVQKFCFVFAAGIGSQLIGQHICAAYTFALHHGHREPVKHQHTQHHNQCDAYAQHSRNQVSNLAANPFGLLVIIFTVYERCHIFHS